MTRHAISGAAAPRSNATMHASQQMDRILKAAASVGVVSACSERACGLGAGLPRRTPPFGAGGAVRVREACEVYGLANGSRLLVMKSQADVRLCSNTGCPARVKGSWRLR